MKLFKCGETIFNDLDAMNKHMCMSNEKYKYWIEMYDNINNYNDWNHAPLSNTKIREAIDKVILEEQAEANNATVDTNKIEHLIKEVTN